MEWNMAAECISMVTLTIIWAYSRTGKPLPSLKNRMFQGCFLTTFCAMLSNILSTLLIANTHVLPLFLPWLVTTIYFIATPLMGMAYFFYAAAAVYENRSGVRRLFGWSSLPGLLYFVMVMVNPIYKGIFDIGLDGTYMRGPYIDTTYLVFYIYCFASLLLAIAGRKWVEPQIGKILFAFPLIAAGVIFVQQLYPDVVLTGSAATNALLIIYLYLQNRQISTDYLTGLPNRQEFLRFMAMQLQRKESSPFAILVLSLRDFKEINDAYGQQNGDAFLQAIGNYLVPTVPPQCLYRFSGDEFALFLRDSRDDSIAATVHRIMERMDCPWVVQKNSRIIRSVIGVVKYPDSADSVEGLINGIEYAISHAKNTRTEKVCYCGAEMLEQVKRRAQIVDILKERLGADGFTLYYQPIYSVREQRFTHAESLLRIPQSPLGPLFPNEFIPVAEESGLIVEMTYQILATVCRFVNRLTAQGVELAGVNVNFSGVQFNQRDLSERVLRIIRENGTPCNKIRLEITESVLADSQEVVVEFTEEMHRNGIRLGLDDFGTGFSNVVKVTDTPFDTIKLDKSLVWSAMENERSAVMVKNLVHIFHEMGMNVLAEGVETEEQRQYVMDCGIDYIQGYYFAKPLPEEDAIRVLSQPSVSKG